MVVGWLGAASISKQSVHDDPRTMTSRVAMSCVKRGCEEAAPFEVIELELLLEIILAHDSGREAKLRRLVAAPLAPAAPACAALARCAGNLQVESEKICGISSPGSLDEKPR